MDQSIEKAKKDGKVSTILNRHRLIPEINSSNGNIAAGASRMAFNTIIQGSAADIIKIAMLRVFRALKRTNLKTALLLQVHDELLLEVPEEEIGQVTTLVKEEMEGAFELESILKVDISIGDDWSQAH